MDLKRAIIQTLQTTALGARLLQTPSYQVLCKAVCSLILNLLYAFYNGFLGIRAAAPIFLVSAGYYLLLCLMRFAAVLSHKADDPQKDRALRMTVGALLLILSVLLQGMIFISIKYNTAAVYGIIPMLTITLFTFAKITAAAVAAYRHRKEASSFLRAVNAIRYCEVAVSLLTMQQSMLVSFGGSERTALLLNAGTGAAVCSFIFVLGILTLKTDRKE